MGVGVAWAVMVSRVDGVASVYLHSITRNRRLAALAAHHQLIEFAVDTVRGRGGRVAAPDRK